ncbi:MAG: alkaline phosphatase D family protein, partial [Acidimicrobiia bacterium]|nr:alkaline phosphatase D family protein [Acidimicrobiia bacterium]
VDPEAPTTTLDHYRRQYHLYRSDLDLQAMHAAFPLAAIFDNHDGFTDPSDSGGAGARAAFFEQLPVRRLPTDPDRQYRSLALGDLCELFLLDERQYRDPEPKKVGDSPPGTSSVDQPEMVAPGRTMLGADQKSWLKEGLASSGAAWKILGSQLVFSPTRYERLTDVQTAAGDGPQRNAGRYRGLGSWDGYQAERRELVDHVHDEGIEDLMVISGDAHVWKTSELPTDWDDPEAPLVLAEFAGTSVTSANSGEQPGALGNDVIRSVLAGANPYHLRYVEVTTHGYGLIELSSTGASITYVIVKSTSKPMPGSSTLARFELDRGSAAIRQVEGSGYMPRPESPEVPGTTDSTDTTDTTDSPGTPEAPGTSSESSGTEPGGAAGAEPLAGQPAYTG